MVEFQSACETIGGEVGKVGEALAVAVRAQMEFLELVDTRTKPDGQGMQAMLRPTGELIKRIGELAEGTQGEWKHHTKAVAEASRGLTWVAYAGPECGLDMPEKHVEDCWQSAEFYTNKILMERRNTPEANVHKSWVKCLKEIFVNLRTYVRKYHSSGPAWQAGPKPAGPPPPPPPPPTEYMAGASQGKSSDTMAAVFAEINQGEAVASRLKRVTDDMKTKNRKDAPQTPRGKTEMKATTPARTPSKKPTFELSEGRKWRVEYQTGNKTIEISDANAKQTVYLFACHGAMVHVRGKVNHITIDKCERCAVIFDSVVSACEVINSVSVEVQCTGKVPTITIDSTTGCQVFLGEDALGAEILTAKCSEVNVLVPSSREEEDMVEHPIPEQFVTKYCIESKKWRTVPVTHA
eukprot:scaffold967_cov321-Pavlova_lutheri.AAC.6